MLTRALAAVTLLAVFGAAPLAAQDNVLDLRVAEFNNHGDFTYQNFIYARNLDSARFMVQALYLRLPDLGYREGAVAVGWRAAARGPLSAYLLAGAASATDAPYFEPALFVVGTGDRWSGSMYLQRYTPVNGRGIAQWLVDPLEVQYRVTGPFQVGTALYAYRPAGGDWLTKLGLKLGIVDPLGFTEVRISQVNTGGQEFQLRRIFAF
jgi:hypothetical protein